VHSFKAAPSLEKPLQQYIQRLQRKPLARGSLVNYRSDLTLFLQFIADYRLQHWQDLTSKQAQAFFREGLHKDRSHTSSKRQLSSVRGFLRYLQQNKQLSFDPLIGLELNPEDAIQQKAPLKPPTKTQCDQLVNFDVDSFISARDKAMIQLLVNTPIALEELISLDVFCVNFQQKSIVLKRPSKEPIDYIMTDACLSDLNVWLAYRQQKMTFDQSLFVSERGNALTTRAVQLRVKFWREKTGVARYTLLQLKGALRGSEQPAPIDRQALLATFMKAHPRATQDD
jgi:integrase/recombinase XerC